METSVCSPFELKVVFMLKASRESLRAQSAASRQLIGIHGTVLHVHLWTLRTQRRCRAESPEFLCLTPPGNKNKWGSGFKKSYIHACQEASFTHEDVQTRVYL